MNSSKVKKILFKFFSLFSAVRGYNILVLVVAQYLAAIFIFSPSKSIRDVLWDLHLFFLILACTFVIAAGYIINNFYDAKIDSINRPLKTGIDNYVHQTTKLKLYFVLNTLGFGFGVLISWRAALFFAVYIFSIWFYSHKLKKYLFLKVISATVLTIMPFFAVFIYFENFSKIILVHASFLFLLLMVREFIKDLQNLKGLIVGNYKTFPVYYGEKKTKQVSLLLLMFTLLPVAILLNYKGLGAMRYYFYFTLVVLPCIGFFLWKSNTIQHYRILHNILKSVLLIGVLCIIFIDTSLFVDKVIHRFN